MYYSSLLYYENVDVVFRICEESFYGNEMINDEQIYVDVTDDWINDVDYVFSQVIDAEYYEDEDENKYFVDGKNVVLDYTELEKEVAQWLVKKFGGRVYMIPRVNNPCGISTPDYLFRGEKWDLKEINGKSMRTIDNALKRKKLQSANFILDISYTDLSNEIILKQVQKLYKTVGREWIDKIIIKKKDDLLIVYIREKKRD